MEVADQWRREWAGTAEYGKVTEGGVTRRIARAMEVLHASGPGARVRVMRAAYHSSAAPGAPAASFMLHSSRRVLSSGFNLLESPSISNKPLEISSTPLESSPEPNTETENYKVTEPDDFEISEPSKWRGSTVGRSIRMPSEESSSTDNASIIDLDSRLGRNLRRKYSYDSESSDIQFASRNNSRNSPLLDMPATLNTLKYKSLLNSSNEWNSRRKSYSFENTSPLSETITHSNDTVAMESSTDSGICKSTEIVNDHIDDTKYLSTDERKTYNSEESFRDWLSKNRPSSHYRGTKFKSYREHDIVLEDPVENNITLQSSGKVSITLPITVETDDESYIKKNQLSEEGDRKVKKVEFCKTELHFAAESGKVNIIATDEKPPPSTDFRKRRSAFVPLQDIIEKPITLYGEKSDFSATNELSTSIMSMSNEFGESDENTAATKSILKNKIPKPKPYLLGENMAFGMTHDLICKDSANDSALSAVSLVNQQLKSENLYKIENAKGEIKSLLKRETDECIIKPKALRTVQTGPFKNDSLKHEKYVAVHTNKTTEDTIDDLKNKFNGLQVSPAQRKLKTRQLRDNELTYFGVDADRKDNKHRKYLKSELGRSDNVVENIFHSVKLIQQVSNSVCNSEPESDETPEYQNIPLNIEYAPVPTPRLRSKYEDKPNEVDEIKIFKPIIEKKIQVRKDAVSCTRRTKSRRQEDVTTSRSISAPPKSFRRNSIERSQQRGNQFTSSRKALNEKLPIAVDKKDSSNERKLSESDIPMYVNLNVSADKRNTFVDRDIQKHKTNSLNSRKSNTINNKIDRTSDDLTSEFRKSDGIKEPPSDSGTDGNSRTKHTGNSRSRSTYKDSPSSRAKKIDNPHFDNEIRAKTNEESNTYMRARKSREVKSTKEKECTMENKDYRNRSLQRSTPKVATEDKTKVLRHKIDTKAENQSKSSHDENRDSSDNQQRNSSKDKTRENIKSSQKKELCYSARIPSVQSKSNEKDYVKKIDSNKTNKHREYVINYDDKNGTVSSICKITPSLGTPKRKKTSKEMLKDNNNDKVLKNKSINKMAPRNAASTSSRGSKRTELCR